MKCVMNNLLCVLLTLLVVSWLAEEVCSEHDYELVAEKIVIDKQYDFSKFIKVHYLVATRFNRTVRVINGSAEFLVDIRPDLKIKVVCFEAMNNNRYSMIPMPIFDGVICDAMASDKFIYKGLMKKSNLPAKCPILKGHYWIHNYLADYSSAPDQLPGKRWRVDLTYYTKDKIYGKISIHGYIDRDI